MPQLRPNPLLVDELRAKMTGDGPRWLRKFSAQAYSLGHMHGWTIAASRAHSAECDRDECATCDNFVNALSLFAAYGIEVGLDDEMMRQLYGS